MNDDILIAVVDVGSIRVLVAMGIHEPVLLDDSILAVKRPHATSTVPHALVDANGICDNDEEVLDPSAFCGEGTVWDAELAQCLVAESTCEGDFDGDNAVTTGDLLAFLAAFGAFCF